MKWAESIEITYFVKNFKAQQFLILDPAKKKKSTRSAKQTDPIPDPVGQKSEPK